MALSWNEIISGAKKFSKKWKDASDERSEAQSFLNDFFNVFGVDRKRVATFERKVPMGRSRNGFIDLLWKGVILVEMKSKGKSLDKAYTQANDYAFCLQDEDLPTYIMVCDFDNIKLYNNSTGQVFLFKTEKLHENVKHLSELAGYRTSNAMPTDQIIDIKASEKMAKLHDILKSHGYEGHHLEVYLVRLLFCMFADDTGIFEKNIFFDYISNSKEDGSNLSYRIAKLFELLNTSPDKRDKQTMLSDELKRFSYINGNLFAEGLPLADFDKEMRKMLLDCCTLDWGYISPAIFGAMFQGVMNPQERRNLGAHYTSEDNIMKVIKPLFLDELWEEFERVKGNSQQLKQFHEKISNLRYIDPSCGCGNFLIITYRELRRLELDVLKMIIDVGGQRIMDISPYCKVNVNQFYGIEYEEFPCQIAQVGLWLMDHQMNSLVAEHFGLYYARLPLKQSATIVHGNALTIDWESVVSKYDVDYCLGNPPFLGARIMSSEQKKDLTNVFDNAKGTGSLDYVTAWYKKATDYMRHTNIRTAFVSTNSISQGEQASILWKPLMEEHSVIIDMAYRTFKWSNEAKGKAMVHCVIIGFSTHDVKRKKFIIESDGTKNSVNNINPYLVDAVNVFIENRTKPLCNVQEMCFGSMPNDGGYYLFNDSEMQSFVEEYPQSRCYFKPFMGADNFINNKKRWCLWLQHATPSQIKAIPGILDRVSKVKEHRQSSKRDATRKLALTPTLFGEIRQPQSNYLIIPRHSSENRKYIPIGFLDQDTIAGDSTLIIPNATLYEFGVLTSNIHMAWVKTMCGRIKSDYRYSIKGVYNNFPWADPTEKQKEAIEIQAKAVLDARALYPDSSLADLYSQLIMPPELTKAHNNLNRAVVSAYGGKKCNSEAERVADLMERYRLISNGN